jgi:hypothetical protein
VRILVSPSHPVVRFQVPAYDINMNYRDIGDFITFLTTPGNDGLKNEVLQYNDIAGINIERPNGMTTLVTTIQFQFTNRDAMMRYLRGEGPFGKGHLTSSINTRLKEFFDARDREEEQSRSSEPTIC